jgi:hypothetical protein
MADPVIDRISALSDRITRLETQYAQLEKTLMRMDEETTACQGRQEKNWELLNARMDKFLNNELVHVDGRLEALENKNPRLGAKEWTGIIVAIITAASVVTVAVINLLGG